jgi:DNA-3-methyladenine glycosylase II
MALLIDDDLIRSGLTQLLETDSTFSTLRNEKLKVYDRVKRDGDFAALIGAILGQQVSLAAAASMWAKLQALTGDDVSPKRLLGLSDDELRGCGFSRQKIAYARGLSEAILNKTFLPEALPDLSDKEIIAEITKLKGFGVWSAHMYLIFSLCRPNVWPAGDLGIQIGAQHYLGKRERPDLKAVEKLGNRFEGYRTAAALLLWDLKAVKESRS